MGILLEGGYIARLEDASELGPREEPQRLWGIVCQAIISVSLISGPALKARPRTFCLHKCHCIVGGSSRHLSSAAAKPQRQAASNPA